MHLITMAHLGEAQGTIDLFKLEKISPSLFKSEEICLIITGEGPFEAATVTSSALSQDKYKRVINLGIAGTLDERFKVGEIYPIRMHYLLIGEKPQFKSFKGFTTGPDCLTSFERIISPEKAAPLKGLASIVDREAWGVAFAAKSSGTEFESHKLISDMAGTIGACETVKESAIEWSEKLALYLKDLMAVEREVVAPNSLTPIKGLHFTFSTQHQFQDLLTKISIKKDLTPQVVLAELPIASILEEKLTPKERTKKLLQLMSDKLDPVARSLQLSIQNWVQPFESSGISIKTDTHWEDPKIKVAFEIDSDEQLKEKIKALSNLSVEPYHSILEGKFNVE